jgi:hypothetical protein
MRILEWTDVFSSVCQRGQDALLWGPAEPWVHIELFAELRRQAPSTGWKPFPTELPCVTFYPVRLPKEANRNWQVDGAVKWVDLCLRSETGNQWCWFELNVGVLALMTWWGMRFLIQGMHHVQQGYLGVGRGRILLFWVLIFAFVGTQMAWAMRPFVGAPEAPFELIRESQGSFYTGVFYNLRNLVGF